MEQLDSHNFMDPVAQVLAQQNSGSAEGQGFGNFFVQGQQLNLSKRRMMLEENQDRREKDLQPLRMRAMELGNQSAGLKVSSQFDEWAARNAQDAILPQIYNLESRFALSPDGYSDANLIRETDALSQVNPEAFIAGRGAKLLMNIQAGPIVRSKIIQARQAADQLTTGSETYLSGVNPNTGALQFRKDRPQTPLSPMGKLIFDYNKAIGEGDFDAADQLHQQIQSFKDKAYAPSNLQKELDYAKSLGITFSNDEVQDIVKIHAGLKAKAGTEKQRVTKEDFIAKNIAKMRENAPSKTTDAELVKQASELYRMIYKSGDATSDAPAVGTTSKGYRYNGKFPASDRRGWDKVQ